MTSGWGYRRSVFHVCLPAIDTGLFVLEAGAFQQIQGGQQIFFHAPAIICWPP